MKKTSAPLLIRMSSHLLPTPCHELLDWRPRVPDSGTAFTGLSWDGCVLVWAPWTYFLAPTLDQNIHFRAYKDQTCTVTQYVPQTQINGSQRTHTGSLCHRAAFRYRLWGNRRDIPSSEAFGPRAKAHHPPRRPMCVAPSAPYAPLCTLRAKKHKVSK